METISDLPPFDSKLSVDEAWARVQAMCETQQPALPVVNINQIGLYSFVIVDQNDVNILKKRHRMIADSYSRSRPDVPFSSARLLPEQAQILVENGHAQIRKISDIQPGASYDQKCQSSTLNEISKEEFNQQRQEEDISSLRATAIKMVVGRKSIKARKRKLAKQGFGSPPSKLLKAESGESVALNNSPIESCETDGPCAAEEEIQSAMQELRQRAREKIIKESSRWRFPPCNLNYEPILNPKFPCDINYLSRLHTFRDLWRKGFYLTAGTKFGCDYLAYTKPPGEDHSRYMVICMSAESSVQSIDLIAISRVASQVQKKVLMAIVTPGALLPYYVKMDWWKGSQ